MVILEMKNETSEMKIQLGRLVIFIYVITHIIYTIYILHKLHTLHIYYSLKRGEKKEELMTENFPELKKCIKPLTLET